MSKYEVIVGNIGIVYSGKDFKLACQHYDEYVAQSKSAIGRAGKENVTLMNDGEWEKEFVYSDHTPKKRPLLSQLDKDATKLSKELAWMTPTQVNSCFGHTELQELAASEDRNPNDFEANHWQLCVDVANGDKPMPIMLKDCSQNDVVLLNNTPLIVWTTDETECIVLTITQQRSGSSAGTVSLPLTTVVQRIWQRT